MKDDSTKAGGGGLKTAQSHGGGGSNSDAKNLGGGGGNNRFAELRVGAAPVGPDGGSGWTGAGGSFSAAGAMRMRAAANNELAQALLRARQMLSTVAACVTHACDDCRDCAAGHRDQIDAILARHAILVQQASAPMLLQPKELAALRRFNETCEDGEGYDVPKEMMVRLSEIGVVRRTTRDIYEMTTFGMHLLDQPAPPPIPNVFLRMHAKRVDQLLRAHGSFEESRWGAGNPLQYHTGQPGAVNLVRAVEQEVLARFEPLGKCRYCEGRGNYAGIAGKQIISVPCEDCGGTGRSAAYVEAQCLATTPAWDFDLQYRRHQPGWQKPFRVKHTANKNERAEVRGEAFYDTLDQAVMAATSQMGGEN